MGLTSENCRLQQRQQVPRTTWHWRLTARQANASKCPLLCLVQRHVSRRCKPRWTAQRMLKSSWWDPCSHTHAITHPLTHSHTCSRTSAPACTKMHDGNMLLHMLIRTCKWMYMKTVLTDVVGATHVSRCGYIIHICMHIYLYVYICIYMRDDAFVSGGGNEILRESVHMEIYIDIHIDR